MEYSGDLQNMAYVEFPRRDDMDAKLAELQQNLMQELVVMGPAGRIHAMSIKFHLIYEFFWVCEQCDAELFGWDPCPEVIWT